MTAPLPEPATDSRAPRSVIVAGAGMGVNAGWVRSGMSASERCF